MIIDPKSLSPEQAKADILAFLDTLPSSAKWKDYFASSVGNTQIELIGGLAVFLGFKIISTRREVFLPVAKLMSTALALSQTLGYSAYRGIPYKIRLTVTPTATVVLTKFSYFGSMGAHLLYTADDYVLNVGVSTDVDVYLGNIGEDTYTIPSADLRIFRFTKANISENYILTLNDVVVPTSRNIKDLINDKWIVMTNYLESVDVEYLNIGDYPYKAGDILKISYIEYAEIETAQYDLNSIICSYGAVTESETLVTQTAPEDIEKIRVNAPLSHETNSIIRGRDDFKKLVKLLISGAVSTNGREDVTLPNPNAQVDISYVKDDLTVLTAAEKAALLVTLDTYRTFGIPPCTIYDPVRVDVPLVIVIKLLDYDTSITVINAAIRAILDDYEKQLGTTLDLSEIEYYIERLSYIKTARITTNSAVTPGWNEYFMLTYTLTIA